MALWGRTRELQRLRGELDEVHASGSGRMLALRGRRQVGKSRLLTEMVEQAAVPSLFTTAVKNGAPALQLEQAMADLRTSRRPLPAAETAFAAPASSWADLFARLPIALDGQPAIVVLDEFPWATETDDTLEAVLQNAWDRSLERLPLLLLLVGSDLAMMERLTEHDRPLFGRAREMVLAALDPAETGDALGDRDPVDVLDVHLATGGYPRLLSEARRHPDARSFVVAQLADDQSPLAITGQRMLDAEFRDAEQARTVLEAIGAVEVGYPTFSSAVGNLGGDDAAKTAVSRALRVLVEAKRVVAIDVPVGAHPRKTRARRYRITDPYLRFWFRYCRPHLADIARGRDDLAIGRYDRDYPSWRGRAVEPLVHDAVARLARIDGRFADLEQVGAWWDRAGQHEYDLAGAAGDGAVTWLGTVTWRPNRPVSAGEIAALAEGRAVVPGAARARLLAVSPAGAAAGSGADATLEAADLLSAWRSA
ncbi:MAG: AAA family ATPase [Egibacteraceae bacterium]